MIVYPFTENPRGLSFDELRAMALNRRAAIFKEWLIRPMYAVYNGEDSIIELVKLIKLIIYALEASIPKEEWKPFHKEFKDTLLRINDFFETDDARQANYIEVVALLDDILAEYSIYVSQ